MRFCSRSSRALNVLLLLAFCGASCVSKPSGEAEARSTAGRDFTFFLLSDVHIGAENPKAKPPLNKADTLARIESNLGAMQGLVGRSWPELAGSSGLSLGAVAAPRALIILGDVTDGHKEFAEQEAQRKTFERLFPVQGLKFGEREVPVFACPGNHDGAPSSPWRAGLAVRNRKLADMGHLAALSPNGEHFALNWNGIHFLSLGLCPADSTDSETPFKYGQPGPGSWNDPQGALSFLKAYLARHVGASGQPVVLMHHYGFDSFSINDWNWWTTKQRRALYELLSGYNVAAIFHGHNHHAEHYHWPDPKRHAADLNVFFDGNPPAQPRQYDVLSCGNVCWVIRVRGDQLLAAHFKGTDWNISPTAVFVKSLKP